MTFEMRAYAVSPVEHTRHDVLTIYDQTIKRQHSYS